ncbi:MAG: hypothetical protein OER87_05790 [Gammaproteobacteria bacterium]|nr:hypothetical protein [Gammaproteobacteria bacterium]MDH3535237.1 hypothetical protein [Gammaproteobacteria bacterium]
MKYSKFKVIKILGAVIWVLAPFSLRAEAGSLYEVTPRLNIVGSSGKPTNDVLGYGVAPHRKLNDEWYLGFGLDYSPSCDFERTPRIVGIAQDPGVKTIDAKGTMTMITLVAERR